MTNKVLVWFEGLKSGRSPPQVKDLSQFEDDPVRIVK